jgi:hypothetical protein
VVLWKIEWPERITYEDVLRRVGVKRNVMKTLSRRRDKLIEQMLQHTTAN